LGARFIDYWRRRDRLARWLSAPTRASAAADAERHLDRIFTRFERVRGDRRLEVEPPQREPKIRANTHDAPKRPPRTAEPIRSPAMEEPRYAMVELAGRDPDDWPELTSEGGRKFERQLSEAESGYLLDATDLDGEHFFIHARDVKRVSFW
jgi:hypothetical protein